MQGEWWVVNGEWPHPVKQELVISQFPIPIAIGTKIQNLLNSITNRTRVRRNRR